MKLIPASSPDDWSHAAKILQAVAIRLKAMEAELWSNKELSAIQLSNKYQLEQLFF